jgi:hypothetical protein
MLSLDITFRGTKAEQSLAGKLFEVMSGHGRFGSYDAPIRLNASALEAFLTNIGTEASAEQIAAVARANPVVFAVEQVDGDVAIVTTRTGRAPGVRADDARHSFSDRFMTPLPKPEKPVQPARPRPQPADIAWPAETETVDDLLVEAVAPTVDAVTEQVTIGADTEVAEAVEEDVVEAGVSRTITVAPVGPRSFETIDDIELANAIGERLRMDPRVANFGDQWMLEERVPRLGRNDLRRLREYLQEQEQPLTDDILVQDVLGGRPGAPDFEQLRFAVNFRLSREHREFDFVGTSNQRFWSTSSLPQIGTTRRKLTEIASDYRFLTEEPGEPPEPRSIASVDHVLTFYEYHLGLLPYDRQMEGLLPAPLLPNQRSAVLTFECPQSYTTYLVELRFPTPNRGGFILGLDDFYNENLVPGALLTIERTDNDGHYLVKYIPAKPQNARLLELEDRRQRYVFRPTTYACGVMEEYLLDEERFGSLASEKPLDEKVRRRPEAVVAASFERLGRALDGGTGYAATFAELFALVNVERPLTQSYLRNLLDSDESGAFARDPDVDDGYTYVPGTTG